jgi:hypothetical protein
LLFSASNLLCVKTAVFCVKSAVFCVKSADFCVESTIFCSAVFYCFLCCFVVVWSLGSVRQLVCKGFRLGDFGILAGMSFADLYCQTVSLGRDAKKECEEITTYEAP